MTKELTKEEIREKHLNRNGLSVNKSDVGKRIQKAAFDAMDEYAKQECIAFAEWCIKHDVVKSEFTKGKYCINVTTKTLPELYSLYIQNKFKTVLK